MLGLIFLINTYSERENELQPYLTLSSHLSRFVFKSDSTQISEQQLNVKLEVEIVFF